MSGTPLISCIITTYKRALVYVSRSVSSVLAQTYGNIELIIVDDNHVPNDFSPEISAYVQELGDNRVRYIKLERNMGACAARNAGIEASRGEFVAFLDDDDEWLPEKLERQIPPMSDERVGLVYCAFYSCREDGGEKTLAGQRYKDGKSLYEQILKHNFIGSTSFPLLRKSCFARCGNFDERLGSAQDLDMWIRILKHYNVAYVDLPLCNYHIHAGEQITGSIMNKIKALEYIGEKYKGDIEKKPGIHNIRLLKISVFYAQMGENRTAFKTWLRALRASPLSVKNNTVYLAKILRSMMRRKK